MKIALIAGATGLVGGKLLQLLISSDNYAKVISLGRRKCPFEHPKLEQLLVDFDNLNEIEINVDDVFCCLGTTIKKAGSKVSFKRIDHQYPLALANYSIGKGAKSLHLVSAMGANAHSRIFYNRIKGQLESDISQLLFKQIHIYRPSIIIGKRDERRTAEGIGQVVLNALGFLFVGGFKHYKAIRAEKIAGTMLHFANSTNEGLFVHSSGEMQ